MAEIIEKQSDTEIKITKELPPQVEERTYDINGLVNRKKQLESVILEHQNELTKIDDLITKAKSVGVETTLEGAVAVSK